MEGGTATAAKNTRLARIITAQCSNFPEYVKYLAAEDTVHTMSCKMESEISDTLYKHQVHSIFTMPLTSDQSALHNMAQKLAKQMDPSLHKQLPLFARLQPRQNGLNHPIIPAKRWTADQMIPP